jgi:hypothetical protein
VAVVEMVVVVMVVGEQEEQAVMEVHGVTEDKEGMQDVEVALLVAEVAVLEPSYITVVRRSETYG